MGVVGAWIKVLTGFFILGATFILNQPIFDFLFALGTAMGGNAATQPKHLTENCVTFLS